MRLYLLFACLCIVVVYSTSIYSQLTDHLVKNCIEMSKDSYGDAIRIGEMTVYEASLKIERNCCPTPLVNNNCMFFHKELKA